MMTTQTVTVEGMTSTHTAIQSAVDAVAAQGGGTVEVPAGTYRMRNALRLRSGVQVVGEKGARLINEPSVSSALVDYLGYGHYEVTVLEPDLFEPGVGLHVLDDRGFGFYTTVATVVGKSGNRLFIDRPLAHDYDPQSNGRAVRVHSVVEGVGVRDVGITALELDGNADEESFELNGCRGGGVYLLESHNVRLEHVEVARYRGDGVSFQQCTDVTVTDCHVHDNVGGGLHPGSGSVRYEMTENRIERNGRCGIFYCLRTTHSSCRGNWIERNAGSGISIGERDTDHDIVDNVIAGNGQGGIVFRPPRAHGGDRVRIAGNRIGPNEAGEQGYELDVAGGLRSILVTGNTFTPAGNTAIGVGPDCTDISVVGNEVDGRALASDDVGGAGDSVSFGTPVAFPPVGPDAADADAVRHLG